MLNKEIIKKLPKVELHEHLDGGLRPETIIEIAEKKNIEIPSHDPEELRAWFIRGCKQKSQGDYRRNHRIFKEKAGREEKLNALQEYNSTLNDISKTTNEIDALYQSAQYKREVLGQKLQGALNNMFGEKYRSPLREAEREKVYKNLLHERGDEIATSIKEEFLKFGVSKFDTKYRIGVLKK